jgi:hypothetical protein
MKNAMAKKNHETEVMEGVSLHDPVYGMYDAGSGVTIDLDRFASLYPQSFGNAARRGLAHKFSNEIASTVTSAKEKHKAINGVEMDDEEVERLFESKRSEMAQALLNGDLQISAPGAPRGSGLENLAFEIAFKRAKEKLEPQGFWPQENRKLGIKADEATVNFAGSIMKREEIAQAFLNKYREEIEAEAKVLREQRIAEAKAKSPKVRKDSAEADLSDLI